jgi:threonine/homoserine/homoserine lactone efflux protein
MLMDLSTLLAFVLSSLLLMATPAPIMIPVIARGVAQGRKAAFLTVLGSSLGDIVQVLLVMVGLSTFLLSSVLAFKIIKYAGAAYFIYLGIRAWRSKHDFSLQSSPLMHSYRPNSKQLIWQGFVPSVLNPDATLFFLAFLPQFVDPNSKNIPAQIMTLGIIFTIIGLVVYGLIAYFSGSIGLWLRSKEFVSNKLQQFLGGIFIAFGIRVALQEES